MWSQIRSMSGQGQIMIQVGLYANPLKRLDKPSRLAPFAGLYLHSVATSFCRERRIVTSFDLRSPPRDPDRQLHPDLHR